MNIDTRISNDLFSHPKTFQLQTVLGEVAILYVIKLWLYVSKFFPDGKIRSMDAHMLEKLLGWSPNHEGNLIETLVDIGFLDIDGANYIVHDWLEHNAYASGESDRKDVNRFNSLKRYMPDIANLLKKNGISSISAERYKVLKNADNPLNEAVALFNLQLPLHMQSQLQSHDAKNKNCNCDRNAQIPNTKYQIPNININNLSHTKSSDTSKNEDKADMLDERENIKANLELDDNPSIEFVELRDFYDRIARPEGSHAGWIEFKRVKKSMTYFPGIHFLMDDISKRIDNGFWDKGFEPGLAKYLNDRTWEQEVVSRQRDRPKSFEELAEERERKRKESTLKRLKAIQDRDKNEL